MTSVSALRSVVLVTTRSFSAWAGGAAAINPAVRASVRNTSRRMVVGPFVIRMEAQELRSIVREKGLHRPLRAGGGRILRPVVAEAQEPLGQLAVREGLDAAVDVETLAVALARL